MIPAYEDNIVFFMTPKPKEGRSGSPVVNNRGEVIGIVYAYTNIGGQFLGKAFTIESVYGVYGRTSKQTSNKTQNMRGLDPNEVLLSNPAPIKWNEGWDTPSIKSREVNSTTAEYRIYPISTQQNTEKGQWVLCPDKTYYWLPHGYYIPSYDTNGCPGGICPIIPRSPIVPRNPSPLDPRNTNPPGGLFPNDPGLKPIDPPPVPQPQPQTPVLPPGGITPQPIAPPNNAHPRRS